MLARGVLGALAVLACYAPAARGDDRAPAAHGGDGRGAGGSGDVLARLAAAVRARLGEAASSHAVKLVPPVPVVRTWRPQKLGSLDLGAPIVTVTAGDLDGDGRAELYLVTSREVIAVAIAGRPRELGRVAFAGEPAVPASRDVVGTAVIDGGAVVATVSAWAHDLRVEWRGKVLAARPGPGGFLVCGDRLALAPGRNHFRDSADVSARRPPPEDAMLAARCRSDLVDPAGAPLRVRGELAATGVLDVAVERCAAVGDACQPLARHQLKDVGVAFELADVDRDGTPDVIAASASAPGDADAVRVISLASPGGKPSFKKVFNGGVAGVAVADADGDGTLDVIAVVRLAGATRVDLWKLDG